MKEVILNIAKDFNITQKLAKEVVDATIASLASTIVATGQLKISGFGSFNVTNKAACVKRNPKTGLPVDVPAKKALKFKVAKGLKEAIQ